MTVYHVYRVLKPLEDNGVTEENTEWLATFAREKDAESFRETQQPSPLGYFVFASREY